ncbi:MAG: DUF4438 domain-containing protein [Candidatus Methanofastidiosia archaeon]
MIKTNEENLVKLSVLGEISHPIFRPSPYKVSAEGEPLVLPGVGGVTYNIRVGDRAVGWWADHVEPGVSIKNLAKSNTKGENFGLNFLSCIGNEAKVVSGEAKGETGTVVGKHGGIEHVLVDFPSEILEKLVIGDKILVKSFGVGLKLEDFSDIFVMNMDPRFLKALKLRKEDEKLLVPVTHEIPASIMGSGLGQDQTYSGDYDIQLFDDEMRVRFKALRLGDLVTIRDADHSYGRIYRKGAVSVGIVVHSDCVLAGHGPGVTTLLTSSSGKIEPEISKDVNIAKILGLRNDL